VGAAKSTSQLWRGARPRRWAAIAIGGTLCLYAILIVGVRERITRGYPDFTVYYTAATMLRGGLGHELYNEQVQSEIQHRFTGNIPSRRAPLPYIHPPYEALLFVPLTFLRYSRAFVAWDLLNAVALFGIYWILRGSVAHLRLVTAWEFVLAALAFFPVFACFLQGQDSILLLLLCTLGFKAVKRKNDFLAGCWFGLGLFKFQLVVPIILLLTIWKRRQILMGFIPVAVILAAISAGLTGWKELLAYPHYVMSVASTPAAGGVPARLLPNLRGLVAGWPSAFSTQTGNWLVALISVAVFWFAATLRITSGIRGLDLQISLAIVVGTLVAWQTNTHDLSLLIVPMVLSANYYVDQRSESIQKSGSIWKTANSMGMIFPIVPLLIGPLWLLLWLLWSQVNLMALPILWWMWEIGKNLGGEGVGDGPLQGSS
jgi:Glycosyltransferase family 87